MQRFVTAKGKKKFLFCAIGIIFLGLCGIIFLPTRQNLKLSFTSQKIAAYDDRIEKTSPGNSEIFSIDRDSVGLRLCYILKPGFAYPYAGIRIPLDDNAGHYLDCSRFDALKITIASSQQSDCKLYLKVFDEKFTKHDNPLSERYLKKDIVLTPVPRTYSILLEEFETPEWWYQKNNITLKDVAPLDLSKVVALQIESGSTAKTGVPDTLTVSGLSLARRPNIYALGFLVAFLLMVSGGYIIMKAVPRSKNSPVIITYDKKEVRNYRDMDAQRISDYLAKHYSEPDISIVTMGKALGLSQKKTAKVMNEEFKMSFKQYLTSIRIHEAKRLLLESDRLVIDVALEVGFNNVSHFNRVFKAATQTSPLEFRNGKSVNS